MLTNHQLMRSDALGCLDDFGEPVVYYPGGDPAQGRTILAVVDRNPTAPMRADQRTTSADDVLVTVANDPDRGVSNVTAGRDTFHVAVEPDRDATRNLAVYRVERVDAGMFTLRLR